LKAAFMKNLATVAAAVLVAFAAGFGAARVTAPAGAAVVPMTPQVVDVGAMTYAGLPALAPGGVLHGVNLVTQDAMTVDVQIGTVIKHLHTDADEIQYVVDGTGTEWLGDKQVALKPGLVLLIPRGTPHGGSTETSGHLKLIAIHSPPIQPGGTKPVP
jgi:mannose-6-phosphate isomerase-like protein (cupin superfamily)